MRYRSTKASLPKLRNVIRLGRKRTRFFCTPPRRKNVEHNRAAGSRLLCFANFGVASGGPVRVAFGGGFCDQPQQITRQVNRVRWPELCAHRKLKGRKECL